MEQTIAWSWAIVIAFAVPECGTLIRSLRLWYFKSVRSFTAEEFLITFLFETLHVMGLSLLAFEVLPSLDVIQGAMLTNCLCFVPSVLSELTKYFFDLIMRTPLSLQVCFQDPSMNPNEELNLSWTSLRFVHNFSVFSFGRCPLRLHPSFG